MPEHTMWYDKPVTAQEMLAAIPPDPATAAVFVRFRDELTKALSTGERESVKNLQNYRRRRAAEKGRTA